MTAKDKRSLVASIALAIVMFRVSSFALTRLFFFLLRLPFDGLRSLASFSELVVTAIAVSVAVLAARKALSLSITWKLPLVVLLCVIAVLPIQVRTQRVVELPQPVNQAGEVGPITVVCRLLDTNRVDTTVFTSAEIRGAKPYSTDGKKYAIRLTLSESGAATIQEATQFAVGRDVGFFLNGQLRRTAEVIEPITDDVIFIPGPFEAAEAQRLAQGIEAACSGHGLPFREDQADGDGSE